MPSPISKKKMAKPPFLLIIHQEDKKRGVAEYLLSKDAINNEVSCHFAFSLEHNDFVQMLPIDIIGWHAGISSYHGCPSCNKFSIGIELPGPYDIPLEQDVVKKAYKLIELILLNCESITDICGHKDVAPKRRKDPHPSFNLLNCAKNFGLKYEPKV